MKQEILQQLVVGIGGLLSIVIGFVLEALRKKLKDDEFGKELGNFSYLADIAVNGVEQLAKHDETINKFEEAKRRLIEAMDEYGIKGSDQIVETVIEDAVKRMNDEEEELDIKRID